MSEQITKALVSFWSHRTDTGQQHFVCSGVFVKPGWVLTVKHAFLERSPDSFFVRPNTGDLQAYPLQEAPLLHPELDAALVRIEVPPTGATCLDFDYRTEDELGTGQTQLFGFFEGRLEKELATEILNFEAQGRYYVSRPKHPVGHSGSSLCIGSKVWAVASAHYLDGNTSRGCFISAGQLRSWLDDLLAGLVEKAEPPSTTASLSERLKALRTALVNAFAHIKLEPGSGLKLHEGLPLALHQALADDNEKTGEACLDALRGVFKQLNDENSSGLLGFGAGGREKFRSAMQVALAAAGRACLDLNCVRQSSGVHQVPAKTSEGATLAVRDEPYKSWVSGVHADLPVLRDKHVIKLEMEWGEDKYAKNGIAQCLYRNLLLTEQPPPILTDELLDDMLGLAYVEAKNGRQRLLAFKSEDGGRLNPDLRDWAQEMSLGLLELEGQNSKRRLFLLAEPKLLATLRELMHTLNQPPWHTP